MSTSGPINSIPQYKRAVAFCHQCKDVFDQDESGEIKCPRCSVSHVRWWQEWHWRFSFGPDWGRFAPGWRVFHVGLIKLIRDVPEGMRISKGDYRGFLFTIRFWLPWEIER